MYSYFRYIALIAIYFVNSSILVGDNYRWANFQNSSKGEVTSQNPKSELNSANSVSWSPNGNILAIGGSYEILLYNKDLKRTKSLPTGISAIHCLAWNPDGTKMAIGGRNKTIEVWDVNTSRITAYFSEHTNDITVIAWKPDSKLIASASMDGTVRIWDAGTGKQVQLLRQYISGGMITSVQWSEDGKEILIVAPPEALQIIDVTTTKLKFDLPDQKTTNFTDIIKPVTIFAAWNRDNTAIAIGYGGVDGYPAVKLMLSDSKRFIAEFQKLESLRIVDTLAWSPDGRLLAVLDDNAIVYIWDTVTNQEIAKYAAASLNYWPSYPNRLSWRPNGEDVAIAHGGNAIHLLNITTHQAREISIHEESTIF